ncbi:glycosyl hydrolase family 61-domain-containing protein [Pyronema omphalodes]|nr:glycosyl hydrolase family 61-domain-containing protein [Pyronema omphalodes]
MHSTILLSLAAATLSAAHGIVSELDVAGTSFGGYNPYGDPYMNPVPERIVWAFPTAGNGPVEDVSTSDIVCNKGATAAKLTAPIAAGKDVTFFWTTWPESHRGPVMTYMANCNGDCSKADPTALSFFKINHAGLNSDGTWASDDLIKNNNTWTVTIPSDIAAGNYLLRHEILALHSAGNTNGAQFYPMCANLEVSSSGSAKPEGVKFPGAYSATDPGILVNIYNNLKSYVIPGPAVYGSGSGSSGSTSTKAAAAPVKTSSAAVKPTSAIAAPVIETSAAAADPTTVAKPTFASTTGAVVVPTTAVVKPTTLQTVAKPVTTTAAPGGSGSGKSSVEINKCLDEVNQCIARAQSKTGGAVDFSSCESQRSACYSS